MTETPNPLAQARADLRAVTQRIDALKVRMRKLKSRTKEHVLSVYELNELTDAVDTLVSKIDKMTYRPISQPKVGLCAYQFGIGGYEGLYCGKPVENRQKYCNQCLGQHDHLRRY